MISEYYTMPSIQVGGYSPRFIPSPISAVSIASSESFALETLVGCGVFAALGALFRCFVRRAPIPVICDTL